MFQIYRQTDAYNILEKTIKIYVFYNIESNIIYYLANSCFVVDIRCYVLGTMNFFSVPPLVICH